MSEGKASLMNRLRGVGVWPEAEQWKDAEITKLRGEGMKRTEAAAIAWRRLAERYPAPTPSEAPADAPPETVVIAEEPPTSVDVADDAIGGTPNLTRDILWCYDNLDSRLASNPPSAGARAMLAWARSDRERFFGMFLPKALKLANLADEPTPTAEPILADIEKMLRDAHASWEQSLIADAPAVIASDVRGMLDGWTKRFGLTIPPEARHSLLCRIVDEVYKASVVALREPSMLTALPVGDG
jgi:hypothetical protein